MSGAPGLVDVRVGKCILPLPAMIETERNEYGPMCSQNMTAGEEVQWHTDTATAHGPMVPYEQRLVVEKGIRIGVT